MPQNVCVTRSSGLGGLTCANRLAGAGHSVLLLEHLREGAAAQRLMQAIERATADPALRTRDLGGTATTAQVTQAVSGFLSTK